MAERKVVASSRIASASASASTSPPAVAGTSATATAPTSDSTTDEIKIREYGSEKGVPMKMFTVDGVKQVEMNFVLKSGVTRKVTLTDLVSVSVTARQEPSTMSKATAAFKGLKKWLAS
jgi:hypothetical protein